MSAQWSLLPPSTPRRAFGQLLSCEARLAWRQPIGLAIGLGVPVLLVVIFGSIPAARQPSAELGGLTLFNIYIPILVAFVVGAIALLGLPGPLASYRELGILRRLSTTPVPPAWLLAAQLVINFCIAAMAEIIVVVLGIAAFGAHAPDNPGALVLAILLTMTGLFGLGLCVAATARTARGAGALGGAAFYPLMFFAGLWVPLAIMPPVLRDISDYTPLGAAVVATQDAILPGTLSVRSLLLLAGYGVVFGALAVRSFRWE
jgi:ABC-2 type transport system permease protein